VGIGFGARFAETGSSSLEESLGCHAYCYYGRGDGIPSEEGGEVPLVPASLIFLNGDYNQWSFHKDKGNENENGKYRLNSLWRPRFLDFKSKGLSETGSRGT
jgi:hypothetical protein